MYESFLIMFREVLEMALITGIILAYLKKTNAEFLKRYVYSGVLSALVLSLVLAFIFQSIWGGFSGRAEEIFEGFIMLAAALLLTTMIFWFFKRALQTSVLENKIADYWKKHSSWGVFLIVFLSVLREGVEIVFFISAAIIKSGSNGIFIGSFFGALMAIILGYMIFALGKKLSLKKFFLSINILLILFAAGLMAHGVHELQEAGLIPIYIEHLFDINHIINENSTLGSILKAVFGYNGNPSLLETIVYFTYILVIGSSFKWFSYCKKGALK